MSGSLQQDTQVFGLMDVFKISTSQHKGSTHMFEPWTNPQCNRLSVNVFVCLAPFQHV